jgi:hypothetical protein
MMNPRVFAASSLLIAAFITDYKTTRYCADRHLGRETNPLLGQSPAQEVSVGLSLTGLSIWAAGVALKDGHGNLAVLEEYIGAMLHTYAAAHNAIACGY